MSVGRVMFPPSWDRRSQPARGDPWAAVASRWRRRCGPWPTRSVRAVGLQDADPLRERLEDARPDRRELVHQRVELAMAEDEELRRRVRDGRRGSRALGE